MIPHLFHRLWYGPRPMPQRYREFGRTWTQHNPDYTLTDWENYRPRRLGDVWDACGTEWEANAGGGKQNSAQAVQRADIASYELIYERGGVYLNCDMEARRALPIGIDDDCFLVWEADGDFPSNACFGATPGHPFLAHVIDLLPKRLEACKGQPMNETTGPHLLQQALNSWGGPAPRVFPSAMFMPFTFGEMHRANEEWPGVVALHHWGHRVPDEELWPE